MQSLTSSQKCLSSVAMVTDFSGGCGVTGPLSEQPSTPVWLVKDPHLKQRVTGHYRWGSRHALYLPLCHIGRCGKVVRTPDDHCLKKINCCITKDTISMTHQRQCPSGTSVLKASGIQDHCLKW